ncbi:CRISPR-associated protein, Cas5h family [Desulforamulus reducens MI-1]|uniref:CRISPR-associated protein, Cas5h family n=1 Tax=Desulforamulus reducens (strain ATCC BAA-1160 / DSM 100696 / MI-1) TaxID=349161 RepID=A4J1X9_DESRM|nr:type I-B CRISPR-associated protein Cas5b [Desulforamulus reducens]ABO49082.1 CRISPR-associated protein, Cas5h family [Desulforamulus reducens MI-1]
MMKLIAFRLSGRFGHFLRAEAGTSALSYPVPPRTVLLGILGAVLGLEKDLPQELLEPLHIALAGPVPQSHWHKAKLRKDPPEALPQVVKNNQKQEKTTKPEMATLITQEWLFNPAYTIWVALPEPYHQQLEQRLKERCWHFQPCLGLSEMMADIEYLGTLMAEKLPRGSYPVTSIIPQEQAKLDLTQVYDQELALQPLRMPRTVTSSRVFGHSSYFIETKGHPVMVETEQAYQVGDRVLMFI